MHEFNLDGMLLSHDFRRSIYDNVVGNGLIDNYYQTLKEEFGLKNSKMAINILNKQARLRQCNKYWELDYYLDQKVKDMTKTYYCKDKFCLNCKKWRQAQRMKKFLPVLQEYDDDLYFVTFTIPNCSGLQVKETIYKIFDGHKNLVKFLLGRRKLKLIDRSMFNLIGGIRVLEISINRTSRNKYHVHLHCAYILKDFKMLKPQYQNAYSVDNTGKRDYIRKFTREEIVLQKLWFLVYNNIDLRTCDTIDYFKAINPLTNREKTYKNKGYSVTIDKFKPGQYQEMFKYMVKDHATYVDENGEFKKDVISYDEFKVLYFATANVRQLESFGCLKGIKDIEDDEEADEVNELYHSFVNALRKFEEPLQVTETPGETLRKSDIIYVSKRKLYSYLRNLKNVEENKDKPISLIDNKLNIEEFKYYNSLIKDMVDKDKSLEFKKDRLYFDKDKIKKLSKGYRIVNL